MNETIDIDPILDMASADLDKPFAPKRKRDSNERMHEFAIKAGDIPDELRSLYKPEHFATHAEALLKFKMPKDQFCREIANLCNLIFLRFILQLTKPCTFTGYLPFTYSDFRKWKVKGLAEIGPRLPENFRGRIFMTSVEVKPPKKKKNKVSPPDEHLSLKHRGNPAGGT